MEFKDKAGKYLSQKLIQKNIIVNKIFIIIYYYMISQKKNYTKKINNIRDNIKRVSDTISKMMESQTRNLKSG